MLRAMKLVLVELYEINNQYAQTMNYTNMVYNNLQTKLLQGSTTVNNLNMT